MKRNILIFILFSVSFSLYSQETGKFKFKPSTFGYYVSPTFEKEIKIENRRKAYFYVLDQAYYNDFFYDIIKKSMPREVLDSLTVSEKGRSRAFFLMDSNGKIQYVSFSIRQQDRHLFTDDILLVLYQNFKKSKFDMSKIEIRSIDPAREIEKGKTYYCTSGVPFIAKGYEHKP